MILPLVCPKCQSKTKIISFIPEPFSIKQILDHLGLWMEKASRDPPENLNSYVVYEPFDDGWPKYEEPSVVLN